MAITSLDLPSDLRRRLERLGGGKFGAGARIALAAGIAALSGESHPAFVQGVRDELQAVTQRLGDLIDRRLPSGAVWVADPGAAPSAESMADGVIATPAGCLLLAVGGVLAVEASDAGQALILQTPQGQHVEPLELVELVTLAADLPHALAALARASAGHAALIGAGKLRIYRDETGHLVMTVTGAKAHALIFDLADAWTFAAEVVAVSARALRQSAGRRIRLEQALGQAMPADVGVSDG